MDLEGITNTMTIVRLGMSAGIGIALGAYNGWQDYREFRRTYEIQEDGPLKLSADFLQAVLPTDNKRRLINHALTATALVGGAAFGAASLGDPNKMQALGGDIEFYTNMAAAPLLKMTTQLAVYRWLTSLYIKKHGE